MTTRWRAWLVGLVVLLLAAPGHAQSPDVQELRRELETLKEGQAAIRRDLEELKRLLTQGRAGAPEPQVTELPMHPDTPMKGSPQAPLVLVEFSDYQCPFCARHFRQTMPELERDYIGPGKLRYAFRDFPLDSIHPQATEAAIVARCAGDQGKYWAMHDRLFAEQTTIAEKDWAAHARAVGVDEAKLKQCVDGRTHAAAIRRDLTEGLRAGIRGTPMFFLGTLDSEGKTLKILGILRGAQPYAAFREAIEAAAK
jgi:protein-disulfide isomerase